jgi:hypothetical protein
MGQAKAKREEMRKQMLVELGRLMAPSSPEEDHLNDKIRALRFYDISRVAAEQLRFMEMEPQQCHQNAAAYVKLDPSGASRHVWGWWKRGGIFYLHSVVRAQGKLLCVTPNEDNDPLKFAPDDEIEWREEEGVMTPLRMGRKVPYLVRDFPEEVISAANEARDELLAGADPRSIKLAL